MNQRMKRGEKREGADEDEREVNSTGMTSPRNGFERQTSINTVTRKPGSSDTKDVTNPARM